MLRKVHFDEMRAAWPFVLVLLIGTIVFLADNYELQNPFVRELILTVISVGKSIWFVRFVVRRIRISTEREFYFHEFMAFIGISVLLFVLSFAIDFYCLYQIRPEAFRGLPAQPDLLDDFVTFFYFSVTNFTTAGLGDIVPNTKSARLFVASELIISFFFTIFIIANLAMLRESFAKKRQG
ncbi:MAG: hypothetical protein IT262_21525 [Saprospiraceae bacterium]|nr:hypothetical protein [Saprospiraceae bacterium]